jgi:hypothetical protein
MHPQLLDLICEGIAIGVCPIADDDDLRLLLAALERLVDAPDARAVGVLNGHAFGCGWRGPRSQNPSFW